MAMALSRLESMRLAQVLIEILACAKDSQSSLSFGLVSNCVVAIVAELAPHLHPRRTFFKSQSKSPYHSDYDPLHKQCGYNVFQ
jgi:hypothetical protein